MKRPLLLLLVGLPAIAIPTAALAQDTPPPQASPAGRESLRLSLGVGPSLGVSNFHIDQVKLFQELGLRLGGGGLVLGLALGESMGDEVFVFQVGGRLSVETAIPVGTTELVVSPSVMAGVFHVNVDAGRFGNATDTYFDLQLALDLHLPLTPRWGLFARPIALDIVFGDGDTALRYDLAVGGSLRF